MNYNTILPAPDETAFYLYLFKVAFTFYTMDSAVSKYNAEDLKINILITIRQQHFSILPAGVSKITNSSYMMRRLLWVATKKGGVKEHYNLLYTKDLVNVYTITGGN